MVSEGLKTQKVSGGYRTPRAGTQGVVKAGDRFGN